MGIYETFENLAAAKAFYSALLYEGEKPALGFSAEFGRYYVEVDPSK